MIKEEIEKASEITSKIKEHLVRIYDEELFITEFRDRPSGYSHIIDGILINLHPSRSSDIEAFEIKASRSDWLKELKSPSKSDGIIKYCDRMWLVSPQNIIKLEEIPNNWGWKILKNKRLVVMKDAPLLNSVFDTSHSLYRDFIITLSQYVRKEFNSEIQSAQSKAYEEAKIEIEKQHDADYYKRQYDFTEERYEALKKNCDAFEETTGIRIKHQKMQDIKIKAQLLNAIIELTDAKNHSRWFDIEYSLKSIEEQIKIIREARQKLQEIKVLDGRNEN